MYHILSRLVNKAKAKEKKWITKAPRSRGRCKKAISKVRHKKGNKKARSGEKRNEKGEAEASPMKKTLFPLNYSVSAKLLCFCKITLFLQKNFVSAKITLFPQNYSVSAKLLCFRKITLFPIKLPAKSGEREIPSLILLPFE